MQELEQTLLEAIETTMADLSKRMSNIESELSVQKTQNKKSEMRLKDQKKHLVDYMEYMENKLYKENPNSLRIKKERMDFLEKLGVREICNQCEHCMERIVISVSNEISTAKKCLITHEGATDKLWCNKFEPRD